MFYLFLYAKGKCKIQTDIATEFCTDIAIEFCRENVIFSENVYFPLQETQDSLPL